MLNVRLAEDGHAAVDPLTLIIDLGEDCVVGRSRTYVVGRSRRGGQYGAWGWTYRVGRAAEVYTKCTRAYCKILQ